MKQKKFINEDPIQSRKCDMDGCDLLGDFPAPKDRQKLREYNWYCLQHVREYNLGWNYYKGMTQGEVEAHNRSDSTWQRPTWTSRTYIHNNLQSITSNKYDNYSFLFDDIAAKPIKPKDPNAIFFAKNTPAAKALKSLGLEQPISLEALKKSYKEMVKLHHPDKNKGCKKSEEKLKLINIAFAIVSQAIKGK